MFCLFFVWLCLVFATVIQSLSIGYASDGVFSEIGPKSWHSVGVQSIYWAQSILVLLAVSKQIDTKSLHLVTPWVISNTYMNKSSDEVLDFSKLRTLCVCVFTIVFEYILGTNVLGDSNRWKCWCDANKQLHGTIIYKSMLNKKEKVSIEKINHAAHRKLLTYLWTVNSTPQVLPFNFRKKNCAIKQKRWNVW